VVVQAFRVLAAIGLHNKPLVESNEIDNPRSDRNLAPEFNAFKLARTQQAPKPSLGVCLGTAKLTCLTAF
jgi:hypothetical protein